MIACLVFDNGFYPSNIFKVIVEGQFLSQNIEYDEMGKKLIIYIYNVDLFKVLQLVEQFEVEKLSLDYGYGFGFSKQEAKELAEMKLSVNKS